MRVLVVAEDWERRALLAYLATSAGHETTTSAPERLLSAIALLHADGVLLDGLEEATARDRLARIRGALGPDVPIVLVVGPGSMWQRALPTDMLSTVVVTERDLEATLQTLGSDGYPARRAPAGRASSRPGAIAWHPQSREVGGPAGMVTLTESESIIVDLLLRDPGAVVPASAVSRALWGDAILDKHGRAAIRSHVYTLRRKLRGVGLADVLVSMPGWGYRMQASRDPALSASAVG